MELNINSPAYFTNQYGVIDEIYTMCRGLSEFVKEKQYSELVNIVGITPIVAPKSLLDQGLFKEVRKCDLPYGFASVSLQMDYDTFISADVEKKKKMIIDNIEKSIKAIPKKAKIDTDAFCSDVKDYYDQNLVNQENIDLSWEK